LTLQPLFRAEITLAPPQELGAAPLGRRRIVPITGGRFRGDGVSQLEARYTLETDDGALVYVRNVGLRHGPPEVLARLAAGEPVDASLYYMRTTPTFETGAAKYQWLNRVVCIATGARLANAVELEVFEVK
jgi:hypothetical protein